MNAPEGQRGEVVVTKADRLAWADATTAFLNARNPRKTEAALPIIAAHRQAAVAEETKRLTELVKAANRVRDCLLTAFPKAPEVPIKSDVLEAIAAIDSYNELTSQPRSPVTTAHLGAAMFDGNERFSP